MSTSEQELSESFNQESPQTVTESPYSSPSQQVPHLASAFKGITCGDDISMHIDGSKPFLYIAEQPQNYFRFRYKSEMIGTHGCLLGKTVGSHGCLLGKDTPAGKIKTHPTVELMNYTGKALIRVNLSQADKDEEHPHKLLEDDQDDKDVSAIVPVQGSYKIGFAGMGIIHTAKKEVPGLLFQKYVANGTANTKELRVLCENAAKTINLNIVRLRFSAYDIETDKEICPPVFSEPIHNMKSAATNDLKICRISRTVGRARGGDDVFILVEKVNKKNIMIRFFEMNEEGEESWSATANFLQGDVHHQYAIVFRTPPYRDLTISRDVKVFIELVRPSDGRTSEPREFVYKADQVFKQNKRRRVNSSFSSLESVSGGLIKSINNVPTTVEMITNDSGDGMSNIPVFQINIPHVPMVENSTNQDLVAEALYFATGAQTQTQSLGQTHVVSPMLGQPNVPEPPVINLHSSELDRIITNDTHGQVDWSANFIKEYMQSFGEILTDKTSSLEFIWPSMQVVADSGRAKRFVKNQPISPSQSPSKSPSNEDKKSNIVDKTKGNSEYSAFYKANDGLEVKKLVKEICDIIKNKGAYKKQVVRDKLERLLDLRLSNGDTFLHMTLSSNQPSFEYIVKLIHSIKMSHLLNLANHQQQTILHLAVIHDLPKIVTFLVSKACDPMMADKESNNAIHYAVICQSCLEPLLDAVKTNDITCDLNAYNLERQTALHLAVIYDSEVSVRLLLKHGASYNARDGEGRTPLHLAVCDDYLGVTTALLDAILPSDIDAVDDRGNTPLQVVCSGSIRKNTLVIAKLLLDKKADPLKHEAHNAPAAAWQLSRDKPALRDLLRAHIPLLMLDDDVKSEPEDEFESADEEVGEVCLADLLLYIDGVSAYLDASNGWRALSARLQTDALNSWFDNSVSPTRTLLTHLKESGENLTSKSLAIHLQDIGEVEAAAIVRKYIA